MFNVHGDVLSVGAQKMRFDFDICILRGLRHCLSSEDGNTRAKGAG